MGHLPKITIASNLKSSVATECTCVSIIVFKDASLYHTIQIHIAPPPAGSVYSTIFCESPRRDIVVAIEIVLRK